MLLLYYADSHQSYSFHFYWLAFFCPKRLHLFNRRINNCRLERIFDCKSSTFIRTLRDKYDIRCKSPRVISSIKVLYMVVQLIQEFQKVSLEYAEAISMNPRVMSLKVAAMMVTNLRCIDSFYYYYF
jgi:hypothetical protein